MSTSGSYQTMCMVHDARLVAAMLSNGVSHILTFNGRDFHRYSSIGIQAIDPGDF